MLSNIMNEFHTGKFQVVPLREIEEQGLIEMGRGNIISKKEMQANPGDYPVYSSSATGDGEIGRYGKYMFDDERITWSIDGGGKLFYRNGIKYSVTNVGGWIKVKSPTLSTKFLYYVLFNQWVKKSFDYTKKAHPSVIREEYMVPMISYPAQLHIVEILDTFTMMLDILNSELDNRIKQYQYYKDMLLSTNGKELTLPTVCQIIDCPHTSPKWKESGVPVIRNYNLVNGHIDTSNLSFVSEDEYLIRTKRVIPQKDDILFSREAPIGNVGIVPDHFKCCQGQRVVLLRPNKDIVLPQYLLHLLQSTLIKEQISRVEQMGSTVSNFNISDLKKLSFCIPEISVQEKTIKKLETFDLLVSDFSIGLPAEIDARTKQYEYYREKLLGI